MPQLICKNSGNAGNYQTACTILGLTVIMSQFISLQLVVKMVKFLMGKT